MLDNLKKRFLCWWYGHTLVRCGEHCTLRPYDWEHIKCTRCNKIGLAFRELILLNKRWYPPKQEGPTFREAHIMDDEWIGNWENFPEQCPTSGEWEDFWGDIHQGVQ